MPRQLLGTAIAANTITTTQLQTTIVNNITQGGGPRVTSLVYPGNDTAGNTVGGQTVYVNGSGFETNNAIYINGNAVPSKSFISASNLSFTTPALSAGIYPVYVINTDTGATAIFIPGYVSSAEPTWVTSAGSLSASQDELGTWTYNLSATGDAPITYALAAGSSLPGGISLAANGLISGTISSPSGNVTTYTFSVVATDAQNQDSTRQFTVTTSTGEGVLFANNVLLIHADGTNNGNNHAFVDSSNNNFTITRNGNSTQGSYSPFSQTGWSAYFDGTGDYLSFGASGNTAYDIISGNFTVECWIYDQGSGAERYIFSNRGASSGWELRKNSTNLLQFFFTGGSSLTSTSTITSNKWTHVAVTRNGNTVRIFIDGVLDASSTFADGSSGVASSLYIGYGTTGGGYFLGNISNARIIKGNALYTATFTPSTSALTAVANTSLLTCQSNRFIDNSTNAFTITRNGDVSIQAWSPFAPSTAYSTSAVGGSGYFDGTGDYLTIADNAALDMSSSNFTIEGWYYPNGNTTNYPALFSKRADGSVVGGVLVYFAQTPTLLPSLLVDIGGSWAINIESSIPFIAYQWNHFAVVRNGSAFNLYINGVSGVSATNAGTIPDNSSAFAIGAMGANGATPINSCYISNFRVVKGTAVYTSAFTPPTALLTNIANTSLLLNFTNAGIFDQTAKNVLETVGDAKVSTAQYKYGTGSMYFDGTGDWLQIPYNQYFNIGSSDYTVEAWIKTTVTTGEIVSAFSSSSPFPGWLFGIGFNNNDGKLKFYNANGSGSETFTSTGTVNDNNWNHVAVTKSGTSLRFFINGILDSTHTMTIVGTGSTQPILIGADNNSSKGRYYTGYIDDLRITKGYARYTSNFTPPSSAFKDK